MNTVTPAQLGYRMPAEWEPHAGTWFSWPRPEGISFPGKYDTVPPVYAALIKHLVTVEADQLTVTDRPGGRVARHSHEQRQLTDTCARADQSHDVAAFEQLETA